MRRLIMIAVALTVVSCSRDIQNTEAVKQGVLDHLRTGKAQTGLNVDSMQIDVRSVSFQRDEARATVFITPKGMQGGGMQLTYVLARNGNKWVVRGRTESGVNPHGGAEMQQGLPQSGLPQQGLPPGHPQVSPGGAQPSSGSPPAGRLPPGHPPIRSKQ